MEAKEIILNSVTHSYDYEYSGIICKIHHVFKAVDDVRRELKVTVIIYDNRIVDDMICRIFEHFNMEIAPQIYHQFNHNGKTMLSDITRYVNDLFLEGGNHE